MVNNDDVQQAIKRLAFPDDIEVSDAAARTSDAVQVYCAYIRGSSTDPSSEQHDRTIKKIYQMFFDFAHKWMAKTKALPHKIKDSPNAVDLKNRAQDSVADIQASIIRFALVYMHIDRCLSVVHRIIEKYGYDDTQKTFKWTSDTKDFLKKAKSDRIVLGEEHKRLVGNRIYAEQIDVKYTDLTQVAYKLLGQSPGEKALRAVRNMVRQDDFDRAQERLSVLTSDIKGADKKSDLMRMGTQYLEAVQKDKDHLRDKDNNIFSTLAELNLNVATIETEIKQKDEHIKKYYGPYLASKRKAFTHLREKLLVFGSLPSLTTLYMKLIRGIAFPMNDIKIVREYEADVIQNIDYILRGQFLEIENIERRADEDLDELYQAIDDFETIQKLQTIKQQLDEQRGIASNGTH